MPATGTVRGNNRRRGETVRKDAPDLGANSAVQPSRGWVLPDDPAIRQEWTEADRRRREEWLAGEIAWEQLWRKGISESHTLSQEFEHYLIKIFRKTLNNAARTYKVITWMSVLMFLVGIGLFVYAVVYATTGSVKEYSALFAGMGATTFVAIWVLQPFDRAQSALSNLMQAELCFTSTFEEIKLWKAFPGPPDPNADPAKLVQATEQIDHATSRAMALLERYVEPKIKPKKDEQSPRAGEPASVKH